MGPAFVEQGEANLRRNQELQLLTLLAMLNTNELSGSLSVDPLTYGLLDWPLDNSDLRLASARARRRRGARHARKENPIHAGLGVKSTTGGDFFAYKGKLQSI